MSKFTFRNSHCAPSLETFKARLDQTLGNLIWQSMLLFIAGELD